MTTMTTSTFVDLVRAYRRWRALAKLRRIEQTLIVLCKQMNNDHQALVMLRHDLAHVRRELEAIEAA